MRAIVSLGLIGLYAFGFISETIQTCPWTSWISKAYVTIETSAPVRRVQPIAQFSFEIVRTTRRYCGCAATAVLRIHYLKEPASKAESDLAGVSAMGNALEPETGSVEDRSGYVDLSREEIKDLNRELSTTRPLKLFENSQYVRLTAALAKGFRLQASLTQSSPHLPSAMEIQIQDSVVQLSNQDAAAFIANLQEAAEELK